MHLVSRVLGTLAENLKLPLSLGHLGIDAFVVDSGSKADVKVLFNNRASNVSDILVTNSGVILTLRVRETGFRPSQRASILVQEIFLFKAKPKSFIIRNGCTGIGWMGITIGQHDLGHHEVAILASNIRKKRNRL